MVDNDEFSFGDTADLDVSHFFELFLSSRCDSCSCLPGSETPAWPRSSAGMPSVLGHELLSRPRQVLQAPAISGKRWSASRSSRFAPVTSWATPALRQRPRRVENTESFLLKVGQAVMLSQGTDAGRAVPGYNAGDASHRAGAQAPSRCRRQGSLDDTPCDARAQGARRSSAPQPPS
jgi:hypothetical protein